MVAVLDALGMRRAVLDALGMRRAVASAAAEQQRQQIYRHPARLKIPQGIQRSRTPSTEAKNHAGVSLQPSHLHFHF